MVKVMTGIVALALGWWGIGYGLGAALGGGEVVVCESCEARLERVLAEQRESCGHILEVIADMERGEVRKVRKEMGLE